jgi:16S rRNA G966 N2-methylase RsmD
LYITGVYHFLNKKYKIKSIFDPCAGWGGLAISAIALNLDAYIGVDSNPRLKPVYENIFDFFSSRKELDLNKQKFKLVTDTIENVNCEEILGEHFGKIDCVFSSPPYFTLELYNNDDSNQSIYKKKSTHIENRSYQEWKDKFLRDGYITKSDQALKENGILATHLMDFSKGKKYFLVNDYLEIMNEFFPHFKFLGFIELGKNCPLILLHQKTTGNYHIEKFEDEKGISKTILGNKRKFEYTENKTKKRIKRKEFDEDYVFSPDPVDDNVFSSDYLDAAESLVDIQCIDRLDSFPPTPKTIENPLKDDSLGIEEILDFAQRESAAYAFQNEFQSVPNSFVSSLLADNLDEDLEEELELDLIGNELLQLKNNTRGIPHDEKKLRRQDFLERWLRKPLTHNSLQNIRYVIKKGAVIPDDLLDTLILDPLSSRLLNYFLKKSKKPSQKLFETAIRIQLPEETILQAIQIGVKTSHSLCKLAEAKNYSQGIIYEMKSSKSFEPDLQLLGPELEENNFSKTFPEGMYKVSLKKRLLEAIISKNVELIEILINEKNDFLNLFLRLLKEEPLCLELYPFLIKKEDSPSNILFEKALQQKYPEEIIMSMIEAGAKTAALSDLVKAKGYSKSIIDAIITKDLNIHNPLLRPNPEYEEFNPFRLIDKMKDEELLKKVVKSQSLLLVNKLIERKINFPDSFFEDLSTHIQQRPRTKIYKTLAQNGIAPSRGFFEKALRAKFPESIIFQYLQSGFKPSILLLNLALSKNYSETILNAMIDKGALECADPLLFPCLDRDPLFGTISENEEVASTDFPKSSKIIPLETFFELIEKKYHFPDTFFEDLGTHETNWKIYRLLAEKGISPSQEFFEKALRAKYPEPIIFQLIQSGIKPSILLLNLGLLNNYSERILFAMIDKGALNNADELLFSNLENAVNIQANNINSKEELDLVNAIKKKSIVAYQQALVDGATRSSSLYNLLTNNLFGKQICVDLLNHKIRPPQTFLEYAILSEYQDDTVINMLKCGAEPTQSMLILAQKKGYSENVIEALFGAGA